jgi:hypothetical protein
VSRFSRKVPQERPSYRKLRGYAFDPSLSVAIDTADINDVIYKVRWEDEPVFGAGPVGEYVEVIDFDPTVGDKGTFYAPVDLNDKYILANDGLPPSEGNPQFHQQFVYAVAMLTIEHFEQALGRQILWAPRLLSDADKYEQYVPRLRIYPHALREANAYYSPLKKAILCGYFSASPKTMAAQMPGSLVFTCLSHDIVAHEVTHAILDGLHRNYNRATNPDVLAFHEAFADIVALFQHFTFPDVLKHQIARTQGQLEKQNLLGELAQEVGVAIGQYGSLRDAIGGPDPTTGEWKPRKPDPADYQNTLEPHDRGSILVAAVFEAFLTMYKGRVRDLLRIASGGTGILPQGELHPDLVNRLAGEASKTASHVLTMCVRALDFLPPVDITFGDFLRAVITADREVVTDDPHHYRLAFLDAFRRRGIYPEGIRTVSEESLRYRDEWDNLQPETQGLLEIVAEFLREYRGNVMYETNRANIYNVSHDFIAGKRGTGLHQRLWQKFDNNSEFEALTGVVFNTDWNNFGVHASAADPQRPSFQVLNLRLASRVGPDGNQVNHIIFGLVQRLGVVYQDGKFVRPYTPEDWVNRPEGGLEVEGGCTLIFDLDSVKLKYAISKRLLKVDTPERALNQEWIDRQQRYRSQELPLAMSLVGQYFGADSEGYFDEPFALLHHNEVRNDAPAKKKPRRPGRHPDVPDGDR